MANFYANPYDTSASGFYFDDNDEMERKYASGAFKHMQAFLRTTMGCLSPRPARSRPTSSIFSTTSATP